MQVSSNVSRFQSSRTTTIPRFGTIVVHGNATDDEPVKIDYHPNGIPDVVHVDHRGGITQYYPSHVELELVHRVADSANRKAFVGRVTRALNDLYKGAQESGWVERIRRKGIRLQTKLSKAPISHQFVPDNLFNGFLSRLDALPDTQIVNPGDPSPGRLGGAPSVKKERSYTAHGYQVTHSIDGHELIVDLKSEIANQIVDRKLSGFVINDTNGRLTYVRREDGKLHYKVTPQDLENVLHALRLITSS